MKKRISSFTFFVAAVIGLYAAGTSVSGQMAGGYGDLSVRSKDARSATAFAIAARNHQTGKKLSLVKIEKAEIQVVAGLNYRVCVRVRDSRGRVSTATAVVYKDLKNKRSLSRWKSGGCTDL